VLGLGESKVFLHSFRAYSIKNKINYCKISISAIKMPLMALLKTRKYGIVNHPIFQPTFLQLDMHVLPEAQHLRFLTIQRQLFSVILFHFDVPTQIGLEIFQIQYHIKQTFLFLPGDFHQGWEILESTAVKK
jgi:hypothetical protein